ncbi:alpha/beta hydrolase fold [Pseudonocardia thermophila]|uniref:Alpha/beta hydrolase fold n=2 Tax=Pseudonocardia thermophila TaxID=1848 RepID=A0A1M7B2R1_PSETH|nr:alpha/beta hydrolase fold [Pseudonocardia thermophila]
MPDGRRSCGDHPSAGSPWRWAPPLCSWGTTLGCAAAPTAAGDGTGPAPPALERFYAQQLAWGPCDGFASTPDEAQLYADPALECARMEVPLDYAQPDGRTAQIAVLRRATDRPRIGSLVINPGGPGGSGVQAAAVMSATFGGGPFDVVGFDPRGIGASTPRLDCLTPAETAAERAAPMDIDPSPAGVAQVEAEVREFVAKCVERSGGVDVLANAGTRDVARDMDVLRAVLGDAELTYLGYSYGTFLGSTYAEMFPRNVRAMVLDGAIDPAAPSAAEEIAQMTAFQRAFEVYAADCAQRPPCPLGADPAAATAAFQELARPLVADPAPAGPGRTLSFGDAVTAVTASLYHPSGWTELTAGLAELRTGSGAKLLAIADRYHELDQDAFTIVHCADDERTGDRDANAALAARVRAAAPFLDPGVPVVPALGVCDMWPASPTSTPHVPHAPGLPPVLVVATTGAPATPFAAGIALAEALGGRLLTVEGTQHGAVGQGWSCIDDIAADYLVELTLPPEGTTCSTTPATGVAR